MTFPRKNIKESNEKTRLEMISLFQESDSWSEFCLKSQIQFGIDVNATFSKWKLGYMALNRGKSFVFIPLFLLLFMAILVSFMLLGLFELLNVLTTIPLLVAFFYFLIKIINFNDFCDELDGIQYYC